VRPEAPVTPRIAAPQAPTGTRSSSWLQIAHRRTLPNMCSSLPAPDQPDQ
jgi:hypothetical protein